MVSSSEFIRKSLETHLFFARIMKEHSFFLQVGFTPREAEFSQRADQLRMEFDRFLRRVVRLSDGVVTPGVIQSGEIVTPYTLRAEVASSFFTGVDIPTDITRAELELISGNSRISDVTFEETIFILNNRAINLIRDLIEFKVNTLNNVLSCVMLTFNYPLLIEHILREARLYLRMVIQLQDREHIDIEKEAYEQELFWNRIMAEHSKFIRGLLDPTENALIRTAHNFANEFDELTRDVQEAIDRCLPIGEITDESLRTTRGVRDFNAQATQGLLDCNIQSIIIPLLGDHVLRESNHFIRLLKRFQRVP